MVEPDAKPISRYIYNVQWEVLFRKFAEDHSFESNNDYQHLKLWKLYSHHGKHWYIEFSVQSIMKMNLGRAWIISIDVSSIMRTETYYDTYEISSWDTIGAQAQWHK